MICPKCNEFTESEFCPNCDFVSFSIRGRSDYFYNKGLNAAKSGNLSSARANLSKSLFYNKRHTSARNLLGLVCFETGESALALREWIISSNFQKNENPASEYIDKLHKDSLESYSDALIHYNNGLRYVLQKNEDMAVIQLKRAIDKNQNFVAAHNLLSLCYMLQKNNDKALSVIRKTLAIDGDNPNALSYYRHLTDGIPNAASARKTNSDKKIYSSALNLKPRAGFRAASALLFAAGVFVTLAYFVLLVLPQTLSEKNAAITALENQLAEVTAENETAAKNYTELIGDLRGQLDQVSGAADSARAKLLLQEKIQKVNTAATLSQTGKSEDAADLLYTIAPDDLPEESRDIYDSLIKSVYPKVASTLYNSGVSHYNRKEYDDAKTDIEKCIRFSDDTFTYRASALYYLGLIAEAKEDNPSAIIYYNDLITNYPASSMKSRAESRLQKILPAT
ncbi:hypothetical protein AGMMS49975_10540 [Clostridia bacterium]|nr:hypothetical protein AGMMS49975_10540 [Clostridia bacterium]